MQWRFVKGPGGTLATKSVGTGALFVLIGGGPGLGCEYLLPLAELIARCGHRAVCFQPRGVGESYALPSAAYSLHDLAADVDAVRAAHGAEHHHVVAHSFGGNVAFACLRSPLVMSLTLIASASPRGEDNRLASRRLARRLEQARDGGRPAGKDVLTDFIEHLGAYVSDSDHLPAEVLNTSRSAAVHAGVMRCRRELDAALLASSFRGVVRVFIGDRDPLGIALAEGTVTAFDRARTTLTVVERAGHFPWLEEGSRDRFAEQLCDQLCLP